VPATVGAPGHIDGTAQLKFSGVATSLGSAATWNGAANTCGNYCHDPAAVVGPTGAKNPTPLWTRVDGSQTACAQCHGLPPPAPHPARADCFSCHQDIDSNFVFLRPDLHVDGRVTLIP
jgi:predicted CxxxxCH...CXXCH cytochrome family protein